MLYCEIFNFHMHLVIAPAQALSVSCCDNFCLSEDTNPEIPSLGLTELSSAMFDEA